MRIVAGKHRGRRLEAPDGLAVRPTADRTREALFSILTQHAGPGPRLHDSRVLDAFAGTGALGLEALSRGAAAVTFMESQPSALATLKRNVVSLQEEERCDILRLDVLRPPKAAVPVDLVLMDPPYSQGLAEPALTALLKAGWIGKSTQLVVELMAKEPFEAPPSFDIQQERKYGKARLVFLKAVT